MIDLSLGLIFRCLGFGFYININYSFIVNVNEFVRFFPVLLEL